jgi:hypothetical protein
VKDRHLLGAGAAACAVCCAPPLIGLLGLAGFAATAATLAFVGVVFGLVVGAATLLALVVRRRPATRQAHEAGVSAGPVDVVVAPHRHGPDDQHDTIGT